MKKLLLVACLCVGAFVAVPIASASAEQLTGACTFSGKATFDNPLSNLAPVENGYHFKDDGTLLNKCAGKKGVALPAVLPLDKAKVDGTGLLQCAVANGLSDVELLGVAPQGSGEIEVEGKPAEFNFEFVAAAGVVVFTARSDVGLQSLLPPPSVVEDLKKGEVAKALADLQSSGILQEVQNGVFAVGVAEFLTDPVNAAKCALGEAEELEFKAAAVGTFSV